jgi:uncharacterized RDD family membrane protein YckC
MFPAGARERQGLRAGVVSRTGAMVIDAAYIALLVGVVYMAYSAFRFLRRAVRFTWPQPSFGLVLAAAAIVAVIVLTAGWSGVGRSVGMRLMGLRLVAGDGARVHVVRAFLRAIACLAFPIGLFWSAISSRNASVQDLVFRTSVIYDWTGHVPPALPPDEARVSR